MTNRTHMDDHSHKTFLFKKADIVLIAACFLAAALLGVFFIFCRGEGVSVRILYDGIALRTIALQSGQEDTADGYYLITYRDDVVATDYYTDMPSLDLPEYTGYNLLLVSDGQARIVSADCRDQICVRHKPISAAGESIVCLPHELVIEIGGDPDGKETLDGVTR